MGWRDNSGLGKFESGIVAPVRFDEKHDRLGLGDRAYENDTLAYINETLKSFCNSPLKSMNLPPMSNFQRVQVHRLAIAYGMKSKSQGFEDNRYVVVSKTPYTRIPPVNAITKIMKSFAKMIYIETPLGFTNEVVQQTQQNSQQPLRL